MKTTLAVIVLVTICGLAKAALNERFAWKELDFSWPSEETKKSALDSGAYKPEHNLPLGVARHKNRLFITVPRWKSGVAATLVTVELNNATKSPIVHPYPSWEANHLPKEDEKIDANSNKIVSTFRTSVDAACGRLWLVDTGYADILGDGKSYYPPTLLIFDLNTDKLLKRYIFKKEDLKENTFFANIVVDSSADKCDDAFAYIPDLGGYGIVVYSLAKDDSWRVKHNYFYFDPLFGDYNVGGVNFQWTDGVFGLALSGYKPNGFRDLYFHALSSTKEFSVCTGILRNKTLATDPSSYHKFKFVGDKGEKSQASASFLDVKSGILFYTQVNRDAIACWNINKPFNQDNIGIVAQDSEKLVFPNDLKVDDEGILWVLSDRMPVFIYKTLNPEEYNYRILQATISEAVAGTPCVP